MGDPTVKEVIRIGGEDRVLIYDMQAARLASARLRQLGIEAAMKTLFDDADTLCILAASCMSHDVKAAVTDKTVQRWLDEEMEAYGPLVVAVMKVVTEGYKRRVPPKVPPSGEAKTPSTETTTASPTTDGPTSAG